MHDEDTYDGQQHAAHLENAYEHEAAWQPEPSSFDWSQEQPSNGFSAPAPDQIEAPTIADLQPAGCDQADPTQVPVHANRIQIARPDADRFGQQPDPTDRDPTPTRHVDPTSHSETWTGISEQGSQPNGSITFDLDTDDTTADELRTEPADHSHHLPTSDQDR